MDRKFYDIHYHLFDLSHPNLLAFLLRDDLITKKRVRKILGKLPFLFKILPIWIVNLFSGKISRQVKDYLKHDAGKLLNLLSVMEGATEYHFLYTEYFLLKDKTNFGNSNCARYNKIAVCPLIIDFGYKGMEKPDYFYNFPPAKPVVNQVLDLLNAIYFYYNYDLILHPDKPEKFKLIPTATTKEKKLFEIYPFLGINTQNYDLPEIAEMFNKYFRGYEDDKTPSERQMKLFNKLGTAKVDLEDMIFRKKESTDTDYYSYLFAGIKLYPPLGFDPWPSDNQSELDKVKFLYSECLRLKLPVTVHCSDGGYKTSPDAQQLTDPSQKWQRVLSRPEYRNLKINFAHMGSQKEGKTEWQQTIITNIARNRNVYTDCSCLTPQVSDYEIINKIINKETESNILFGTDFVINLIWSDSYNDYLNNFIQSPFLDERQKELISEINPERFLFG
ncbi:MAG: amidohydrolase family protein [Bacteroidia bacterium]|nr:amidohydrolase family protein [Bacteroidia bacterium]